MDIVVSEALVKKKAETVLTRRNFLARPEIFLLILLNVVAFGRFFLPGAYSYGDWLFWTPDAVRHFLTVPSWFNIFGLGSSDLAVTNRAPIYYIFAFFIDLTKNRELFDRLIWFIPLPIFGTISAYLLSEKLYASRLASFTTAFLFVFNTEFLKRLSGGHAILLFGYALAPLVIYLILLGVQKQRFLYFIIAGLVFGYASLYDIRTNFLVVLIIGPFVAWLFFSDKSPFAQRLYFYGRGLLCLAAVPLLTLLFFILPTVGAGGVPLPAENSTLNALQTFSYADLPHSLALYDPAWPYLVTYVYKFPIPFLYLLLPLLASMAIWLRRHNPYVIFFASIYVVSVFLAKGANPPFEQINEWIYLYVPGFSAFREATKFLLLVAFSLAFLVGVAIKEIAATISSWSLLKRRPGLNQFVAVLFAFSALAAFLVMMKPVFFQEIQENFVTFPLPLWQKQVYTAQANDPHFYRTLWVPGKLSISPLSDAHPVFGADELTDADKLRPFIQLNDTAATVNWSILHNPGAASLLNLIGVKYLYVPNLDYYKGYVDYQANSGGKSPAQLQAAKDFLDVQTWLKPSTTTTDAIPAYQTFDPQDHFFIPQNRIYVSGPDDFFSTFASLPEPNLAAHTLIASDESWDTTAISGSTLVFNQTNPTDYILRQLPANRLIEPFKTAKAPDVLDSSNIWTKNILTSKYIIDPSLQNYDFDFGKGFIAASQEGSTSFELNVLPEQVSQSHLWLRSLDSLRGTSLEIELDKQTLGLNVPATSPAIFHWHDLGTLNLTAGKHTLTIHSKAGLNVVNLLAMVSDADFKAAQDKAHANLDQLKVAQIEKFDSHAFGRTNLNTQVGNFVWNLPKSGQYRPSIHVADGAKVSGLVMTIDGQKMVIPTDKPEPGAAPGQGYWYTLPALNLSSGNSHQVTIEVQDALSQVASPNYTFPLDYAILNEGDSSFSQMLQAKTEPAALTYDYINPTKYVVHIKNATRPFDLVFSEGYDANWGATYSAARGQKPDKAYEMLQAYRINQTGDFDVTVEYRPQKFVYIGLIASAVGLVIVLIALVVFWRKRW